MKAPGDNSLDVTNLRPCDYQALVEALDSPASPTETLRAAFRRRNHFPAGIHDIGQAEDE
jgi:uncharacterized protein (DUF1778 family)